MYENLPPVDEIDSNILISIARKSFVRAGLPPQDWHLWMDDAKQVAWLSFLESRGKHDGWRVSRAKWAVFEFVINHVYGQMADFVEIEDRNFTNETGSDDCFPVEWQQVVIAFSRYLSPAHLAIAIWLLQGKSNFEIAEMGRYSSEDSARAMVSRVRRKIGDYLVSIGE